MFDVILKTKFEPFVSANYNFQNLTGKRFERLLVLSIYGKSKTSKVMWLCLCDCKNIRLASTNNLIRRNVQSCGCKNMENRRARATHKESGSSQGKRTVEYSAYNAAKNRCTNLNCQMYPRYGGRGIKFCFTSFSDFLEEVGRKPTPNHSLDRIDANGNYEKGNLRWATMQTQQQNKTSNRVFSMNGKTLPLSEWVRKFKASYSLVHARVTIHKWDLHKALTTPSRQNKSI